jgi:hypothetical protein
MALGLTLLLSLPAVDTAGRARVELHESVFVQPVCDPSRELRVDEKLHPVAGSKLFSWVWPNAFLFVCA